MKGGAELSSLALRVETLEHHLECISNALQVGYGDVIETYALEFGVLAQALGLIGLDTGADVFRIVPAL